MLSSYITLLKLKTVGLLVLVALISAILASRGIPTDLASLGVLVLSGALACAGAGMLNHYLDRDVDLLQERTRHRPLVAGRVRPGIAFLLGLLLIIGGVGLAAWRLNWRVTLFVGLGALTYVVIYTWWLKRRTAQNIVIGGLAGSCAALAGWFSSGGEISPMPILLAALVFLWTPVHFWSFALAHLPDYRQSRLPMLPVLVGEKKAAQQIVIYAGLTLVVSGLFFLRGYFGLAYLIGLLPLAGVFLVSNLRLLSCPTAQRAWINYKLSGAFLMGLFLTMALDMTWI